MISNHEVLLVDFEKGNYSIIDLKSGDYLNDTTDQWNLSGDLIGITARHIYVTRRSIDQYDGLIDEMIKFGIGSNRSIDIVGKISNHKYVFLDNYLVKFSDLGEIWSTVTAEYHNDYFDTKSRVSDSPLKINLIVSLFSVYFLMSYIRKRAKQNET